MCRKPRELCTWKVSRRKEVWKNLSGGHGRHREGSRVASKKVLLVGNISRARPVKKWLEVVHVRVMENFIKLAVFCYIGKHSKTLAFS